MQKESADLVVGQGVHTDNILVKLINQNMQKLIPFIWFEDQASKAADFYVSIFPDSKIISKAVLPNTPSGDTEIISLNLSGTEFQFMSAGNLADRNPSFSYMVICKTADEVENLWNLLLDGATIMMPLDTYPFSQKYGWLKDKYGVSWQIMYDGGMMNIQKITPCFLFVGDVYGKAEEAMNFYCSIFGGSSLPGHLSRYTADQAPDIEGKLNYARFQINGQEFVIMESAHGHKFGFNEMQSIVVRCNDQKEMDAIWEKLSFYPDSEQCGWLKDKYGISWQMSTARMEEMMTQGTPEQLDRIVKAFLPMKKLDLEIIERAFKGDL